MSNLFACRVQFPQWWEIRRNFRNINNLIIWRDYPNRRMVTGFLVFSLFHSRFLHLSLFPSRFLSPFFLFRDAFISMSRGRVRQNAIISWTNAMNRTMLITLSFVMWAVLRRRTLWRLVFHFSLMASALRWSSAIYGLERLRLQPKAAASRWMLCPKSDLTCNRMLLRGIEKNILRER